MFSSILFRLTCCLVALWAGATSAWAEQASKPAFSTSFIEDASGLKSLDDIRLAAMTPFSGFLARGYTNATFWIRVTIEPPLSPEPIVMSIKPHYLEEVDVFAADGRLILQAGLSRLSHPSAENALDVAIRLEPDVSPKDIWVRVKSRTSLLVLPEIETAADFNLSEHQRQLITVAYLGGLLTVLIFGLLNLFFDRSMLMVLFNAMQLSAFLFSLNITGFLGHWFGDLLGPQRLWSFHLTIVIAFTLINGLFNLAFLRSAGAGKIFARIGYGLVTINALALLIGLFGWGLYALQLNAFIALIYVLFFLTSAFCLPAQDAFSRRTRWLAIVYYISLSAPVILMMSAFLGMGSMFAVVYHANILLGATSALFMWVLIGWRRRQRNVMHLLALSQLELANQRVLEDKKHASLQNEMISIVSHELRNALSIIAAAERRGTENTHLLIKRGLTEVDSLISRVSLMAQIEDKAINPVFDWIDPSSIIETEIKACRDPSRVKAQLEKGVRLCSDAVLVRIIVANIIDNAIKYGAPEEPIRVIWKATGVDTGVMTVTNAVHPSAMPDPKLIFSKYYRHQNAAIAGTGLGLYIVKKILDRLGGQIRFTAAPGRVEFEVNFHP